MHSSNRFLTASVHLPFTRAIGTRSPRVKASALARRASFLRHLDPGLSCPTKLNTANKIPSQAQSRAQQVVAYFTASSPSHGTHSSLNSGDDNMAQPQASLPTRGGFDSKAPEKYVARKIGAPNTFEHRIYLEKDGIPLSPFHDIPLYANEQQTVLNMVVEVPRWTNAKQEVCCI